MSLQWTLVAFFLYFEIAIVAILMLPFFSAKIWQKLFKSRLLQGLNRQANIYFYIFICVLVLFLIDSVRDMARYSVEKATEDHHHSHLDTEMQISVKLFRAQRNFYISGFALFLWLVIRRLVTLISLQAVMESNCEAALKQAKTASEHACRLMKDMEKSDKKNQERADLDEEDNKNQVKELRDEVEKHKKEAHHYKTEFEAMKAQSESLHTEYDRLLEELRKAQQKAGSGDSKKD